MHSLKTLSAAVFLGLSALTLPAQAEITINIDSPVIEPMPFAVPDFIDEWISAPYPGHTDDKRTVLEGLAWIDEESQRELTLVPEATHL